MAERGAMRMHLPAANTAEVVQDLNPYLEAYQNTRTGQGRVRVRGTSTRRRNGT